MTDQKTCATCKYRWCGSFTPRLNRAIWWCRIPKMDKTPTMIGDGSDAALQVANGCREWAQ